MDSLPAAVVIPEVEMAEKTARRRFNAEYKSTVLKKADTCRLGEIVGLLRRKGLFSLHLSVWRAPKKCGLKRVPQVSLGYPANKAFLIPIPDRTYCPALMYGPHAVGAAFSDAGANGAAQAVARGLYRR